MTAEPGRRADATRPEPLSGPGAMGENVTTRGIELLALPRGTRLHLGSEAVIEITGLRNPCGQLNNLGEGGQSAVLDFMARISTKK